MMVPLSVLESAREDANAHAARLAWLYDARIDEAKAETKARVDEAKAHAAREAQLYDARFDEAKARIDEAKAHAAREAKLNDARFEFLEQASAFKLAAALFERDVARGKVTARALVEEATAEAWRAWERLDEKQRQQVCPSVKRAPLSVTEQLKVLLSFPAVDAYLQVVEEDNGLARGALSKSADILYSALCTPLHARAAGALEGRLPAEVFSAIGEDGRIAFAALVAFGGRSVGMYQPCGEAVSVVLRVPPVLGLSATLERIRGSAKLPAVGASVELGVAGGADASGEAVV